MYNEHRKKVDMKIQTSGDLSSRLSPRDSSP